MLPEFTCHHYSLTHTEITSNPVSPTSQCLWCWYSYNLWNFPWNLLSSHNVTSSHIASGVVNLISAFTWSLQLPTNSPKTYTPPSVRGPQQAVTVTDCHRNTAWCHCHWNTTWCHCHTLSQEHEATSHTAIGTQHDVIITHCHRNTNWSQWHTISQGHNMKSLPLSQEHDVTVIHCNRHAT